MRCERCKKETGIVILSRFNTDVLCFDCEETERKDPRHEEARPAELVACRRGDFNFPGIGFKATTPDIDS